MTSFATTADSGMPSEQLFSGKHILILVENLPVPFDRRVWQEAQTLSRAGAHVSVICPTGKGYEAREETINGIDIYRYPLPVEADSAGSYLREYAAALWRSNVLTWKIHARRRLDVIHACNPPDLLFLIALPFKLFGVKFVFDHHDLNPELFEAKFGRRGFYWRMLVLLERLTFMAANVSIATNMSYRAIAIARGKMRPDDVFVVRSGPDLRRLKPVPPNPDFRRGRRFLVGYLGVIGDQEGVDLLLESIRRIVIDQRREDVQFCIVGGGPSLAKLKRMAADMNIGAYVDFLGRVPDDVLIDVLCTADVCVNPDRVNPMNDKSTMNKILEYMALGKPIVQFELTEGRVSAGDASLYARPDDTADFAAKIVELLDAEPQRYTMGQIGRRRIETELSWAHQIPTLLAAYQRVLGYEPQQVRPPSDTRVHAHQQDTADRPIAGELSI